MANLLTRGLGKLQSLIKRGLGADVVIVSDSGGSIKKLKFPRRVTVKLRYNIDGKKAFKQVLDIRLDGVVRFFDSIVTSFKAVKKTSECFQANITAILKYESANSVKVEGVRRFQERVTTRIIGISKALQQLSYKVSGISKFASSISVYAVGVISFIGTKTASLFGRMKNRVEKAVLIEGKRNITNILSALGLLDNDK